MQPRLEFPSKCWEFGVSIVFVSRFSHIRYTDECMCVKFSQLAWCDEFFHFFNKIFLIIFMFWCWFSRKNKKNGKIFILLSYVIYFFSRKTRLFWYNFCAFFIYSRCDHFGKRLFKGEFESPDVEFWKKFSFYLKCQFQRQFKNF